MKKLRRIEKEKERKKRKLTFEKKEWIAGEEKLKRD